MRSPITIAIDLYRFICEEIEDRRMKPEVSRLRLWTRWWVGIGDKINLGIWDGPMETKKEVKRSIREMKKVLEEVEEGERLVAEAGVKITDPRRKVEERQGRRKIREVVKAGALKAKGYVWLDKQGTRSGEHRRELWMHTGGDDDVIFEDKELGVPTHNLKAIGPGVVEVRRYVEPTYEGENPIGQIDLPRYAEADVRATEVMFIELGRNEPMTDEDYKRMVDEAEGQMKKFEEKFMESFREGYTKTAEELEATPEEIQEGLNAWGRMIRLRGVSRSEDGRVNLRGSMQVPRGQGKTAADRMTRKLMEEEGYEIEDVPGVGWKATKPRDLSD